MMPDERSNAGGQSYPPPGLKPQGEEKTLRTEKIQIERKTFMFALKENPRGCFLRITEDVGGRRDTIIVPAPGLDQFCKVLESIARDAAGATASPTAPAGSPSAGDAPAGAA